MNTLVPRLLPGNGLSSRLCPRFLGFNDATAAEPAIPSVPSRAWEPDGGVRREVSLFYNSLGILLATMSRSAEAEELFRTAIAIQEKRVDDFPNSPKHLESLGSCHLNLAKLLNDLGKPEAVEHSRTALSLFENLTSDHPAIPKYRLANAKSRQILAGLLSKQREYAEAESMLQRSSFAMRFQHLKNSLPSILPFQRITLLWRLVISHWDICCRNNREYPIERNFIGRPFRLTWNWFRISLRCPNILFHLGRAIANWLNQCRRAESLDFYDKAIQSILSVYEASRAD